MANGAIGIDHLRVDVLTVGDLTTARNGNEHAGPIVANVVCTRVSIVTEDEYSLADTINTDIPNRAGVAIVAGGSIRSTTCILAVGTGGRTTQSIGCRILTTADGRWRRAGIGKQNREKADGVTDVGVAVIVDVTGIGAKCRTGSRKENAQGQDCIGDVDLVIQIAITTAEIFLGRNRGRYQKKGKQHHQKGAAKT